MDAVWRERREELVVDPDQVSELGSSASGVFQGQPDRLPPAFSSLFDRAAHRDVLVFEERGQD